MRPRTSPCGAATPPTGLRSMSCGVTMTPVESEIVMDMPGTCENPPYMTGEDSGLLWDCDWGALADYGGGEPGVRATRGGRRTRGTRGKREPGPWTGIPRGDGAVCS